MNSFLMAGRVNVKSLGLVMEDAAKALVPYAEASVENSNDALRKTLLRQLSGIQEAGEVSRADMVVLESHFPKIMEDKPLTLWTQVASKSGLSLAMESFETAIAEIEALNAQQALTKAREAIEEEITTLESLSGIMNGAIEEGYSNVKEVLDMLEAYSQASSHNPDGINRAFARLTAAGDENFNRKLEALILSCRGYNLYALRHPDDAEVTSISGFVFASKKILERMHAFTATSELAAAGDFRAWGEALKAVSDLPQLELVLPYGYLNKSGEDYKQTVDSFYANVPFELGEGGFHNAVRVYHESIIPNIYQSMAAAEPVLEEMVTEVKEIHKEILVYQSVLFKTAVRAGVNTFFQCKNADDTEWDIRAELTSSARQLAHMQKYRTWLMCTYCEAFSSYIEFNVNLAALLELVLAEAWQDEETEVDFWDKTQSEVEAQDGYTTEGAAEVMRSALDHVVNFLKKIVAWIAKTFKNRLTKATSDKAKQNDELLSTVSGDIFTEKTRNRLQRVYTEGVRDISKYAGLGNIWSDAYRQVLIGLAGPVDLINTGFKDAGRGEELPDGLIDKIRSQLEAALNKGNFKRLPGISDDLSVENINTRIHEVMTKVQESFKKPVGTVPDIGLLKTVNNQIMAFLTGPVTTARNSVTGHELDNVLSKMNSLSRMTASSPNNKAMGELRDCVNGVRNLIQAGTSMLGLCDTLAVKASRFIDELAKVLVKPSEEEATTALKTEHFNEAQLLAPLDSVLLRNAELLAASGFTMPRQVRFESYCEALRNSVHYLKCAQHRRDTMIVAATGLPIPPIEDVPNWTLGLDMVSGLQPWYDDIASVVTEFVSTGIFTEAMAVKLNVLKYAEHYNPNYESGESVGTFLTRLKKEALDPHTDFTSKEERLRLLSAFFSRQAPFVPAETTLEMDTFIPIPEGATNKEMDSLQNWMTLLVMSIDTYVTVVYGSDDVMWKALMTPAVSVDM